MSFLKETEKYIHDVIAECGYDIEKKNVFF